MSEIRWWHLAYVAITAALMAALACAWAFMDDSVKKRHLLASWLGAIVWPLSVPLVIAYVIYEEWDEARHD